MLTTSPTGHAGAPNQTRTGDLFLTMEALYLLSYGSMAPPAGLEPATYRLTAGRSTIELRRIIRLTATFSIHQSAADIKMKFLGNPPGSVLLSRGLPPQVPSALEGLTSVFGMGTGGSPPLSPPDGFWLRMYVAPSKLVTGSSALRCKEKPSTDSDPSAERIAALTPRTDLPRLLRGVLPHRQACEWEISS